MAGSVTWRRKLRILVTDVTEMHHGNYCVAGWDSSAGKMVRPLPNGSHWTGEQLTKYGVQPGAVIEFNTTGSAAGGSYPHRTEDTPIDLASVKLIGKGTQPWFGSGAPPLATTLAAAFQNSVQTTRVWDGARQGAYVKDGTEIGSLAGVRIVRPNLEFFEGDYDGKKSLRAYITDKDAQYSLPAVAKNLRELYRSSGVEAVNKLLPKNGNLHVRVGLARAWSAQPEKCTVMINGVYW
jgi:hypothetical protein